MKNSYLILVLFFINTLFSQNKEKKPIDPNLPEGNQAFKEKKYADAEAAYRMSAANEKPEAKAIYNLGTSIYKQKSVSEAKQFFVKAIEKATTKEEKHKAFHNLGNSLMKEKNYQEAVEAYKNALRNNPADEQTRYNYALAKKMLKDNPPPPSGGDGKDKKKQPKEQQSQNNNQNQDNQNQDNQNKQNPNKEESNASPKPKPSGLSKDRIENMLEAVDNNEKKVQDKVNKKKVKTNADDNEKDW